MAALCLPLLSGCLGDDDENSPPEPAPPRIAGIWSGTWEGIDSTFGPAAGTWVARISQRGADVEGPIALGGDIDCAEGDLIGFADAVSQQVSGQVFRDPCPFNDWLFTAFDQDEFVASGTWEKHGLSNGSFEGRRIATFSGPEISHVFPPSGGAGTLVTLVGERLGMTPGADTLTLGETGVSIVPLETSDTMIRFRLPANPGDSGRFVLTTAGGKALGPRLFETGVTHPDHGQRSKISLDAKHPNPVGIAASINGRRVFVANGAAGTVSMINVEMGLEWTSTAVFPGASPAVPVHAIAVDPDGRRIYVAGENMVGILHAHTLAPMRSILVPAGGGGIDDPGGIAISPDGRWLLVAEAVAGGRVTILDIDNNFTLAATLQMAADETPRDLAVGPDGVHAYIAVAGNTGEIKVYDLVTQSFETPFAIGTDARAVALTPDGSHLLAIGYASARIDWFDFVGATTDSRVWGPGERFRDIAITPDGRFAYVASDSRVLVFDIAAGLGAATIVDLSNPAGGSDSPVALAFTPDGKRAYVTLAAIGEVVEFGNQRTLRISKQGGGIGEVTSAAGEIKCGATCIASFANGSRVDLSARTQSSSHSRFVRWDGDPDCHDGSVTMNTNLMCVAIFEFKPPPGGPTSVPGVPTCFIATAAYGSWLDPQVMRLREFRDRRLLTNPVGTWFVGLYYRHSPPVAAYIRERDSLRMLVRIALTPVVYAIEYPWAAWFTILLMVLLRLRWRLRPKPPCRRQGARFARLASRAQILMSRIQSR